MWLPTPRLDLRAGVFTLGEEPGDGTSGRLSTAFVHCTGSLSERSVARDIAFEGLAWRGLEGETLWGWPDDSGRVALRPTAHDPAIACLLPVSVSLALALRRGKPEIGATALIAGEGLLGCVTDAVVRHFGFRLRADDARAEAVDGEPAFDRVFETTADAAALEAALRRCRDWGTVYSIGGALSRGPLDYYHDLHRRALTLYHVPVRPQILEGEEAAVERGIPGLAAALSGVTVTGEAMEVRSETGDRAGSLIIEPRTGWGRILMDGG